MTRTDKRFILALMKIDVFANDSQILKELGVRIKTARVRAQMTQSQLSERSGTGKSTVERAEKGQSVQLESLIKLLRALNCVGGLDSLLPSAEATPMEILKVAAPKTRYRARKSERPGLFKWGDEE